MGARSFHRALLGLSAVFAAGGGVEVLVSCGPTPPPPAASQASARGAGQAPRSAATPQMLLRPVPDEMRAPYRQIEQALAARDFAAAAQLFPSLIDGLARAWGPESRDIVAYVYNFALALRLSGRGADCVAVAQKALTRWPGELQLEVIEAMARADAAAQQGFVDPRTEALFRGILAEDRDARLRSLRLERSDLQAQWADVLLRAGRLSEAEGSARAALAGNADSSHAREVLGRTLLLLERPEESLRLLEPLLVEKVDPAVELCAAMALLDLHRTEEAWPRLSRLLAANPFPETPRLSDLSRAQSPRELLRVRAARALCEMGRPAEAANVLLDELPRDLERPDFLLEVARAARAARADGATSIERRRRQLQQRERYNDLASQARAAGLVASVRYYQALAALEVDRTADALARIQEAIAVSSSLAELHVEKARIQVLIGTLAAAEVGLAEARARAPQALLAAASARVVALRGRKEEAAAILQASASASFVPAQSGPALSEDRLADLRSRNAALRALAFLEIGQPAAAAREDSAQAGRSGSRLMRAEAAVLAGGFEEARKLLGASFEDFPGGAVWAAALEDIIQLQLSARRPDGDGAAAGDFDASNLLDHPRLFLDPAYASPGPTAERLRNLHEERTAILREIETKVGVEAADGWLRLVALYRESGAARKAREAAYHLAGIRPGPRELRALASTLSLPEEVLPRLRATEGLLALEPSNIEAAAARSGIRKLLGAESGP